MHNRKNSSHTRAFTLIELLVVIAIIGVLSSVVLASLNTARGRARDAQRFSDLEQVRTALEMYYADHGSYPLQTTWHGTSPGCYSGTSNPNATIPGLAPTYIPAVPVDPNGSGTHCFLYLSNGTNYKFMAHGTIESGPIDPGGPHSRYGAGCTGKAPESSAAVYTPGYACS